MRELLVPTAVVTAYMAALVLVAVWAERREGRGAGVAGTPVVYSLSLAVYATSWTFYGSVGFAARNGLLFLTVYLGPTLMAAVWWWVLRRLVRIKNAHRITGLPDLLALRYEKSQAVALLATTVLVVGLVPYLALQLKTMIATFGMVAGPAAGLSYPESGRTIGPLLVALLLVFTIAFGLRRVVPTERHPGMVVALAAECVVKLLAFVAAGAFVVWGLFDGMGDVFRAGTLPGVGPPALLGEHGVITWLAHLSLSAFAVLLLPRQFHVAVVENSDERHIRTAMWLFPAYLLAINVFVLPLALGALALRGSPEDADTFVLSLPLLAGNDVLSWFVFLGGFSAGTGMVLVETTALATMISNHVVVPVAEALAPLRPLRRRVLQSRWVAAALLLVAALAFERAVGPSSPLTSIGFISFAAVLQLAPALIGGLYWRGASRTGALAGMATGFFVWLYTIVVPVLARAGWLPPALLVEGPFGVETLVPEGLFDVHLDAVSHAVLWTMIANVGAFVTGSLLRPASLDEASRAEAVVRVRERPPLLAAGDDAAAVASADEKRAVVTELFSAYHGKAAGLELAAASFARAGVRPGRDLTALQLAELQAQVESTLAGAIGSAAAHAAVGGAQIVSPDEAHAISRAYGEILAALHVPPEDLRRMIDYHRARERLLSRDAANQRFLAGVGSLLAGSLDLEATARTAVRLPIPHLADAALLALRDEGGPRLHLAQADAERERAGRLALMEAGPALASAGSLVRALGAGRPITSRPAAAGWPEALRASLPGAVEVTLPLIVVDQPLGTLSLFGTDESRLSTPEDLTLAEELAQRLAIAVENARLYGKAEHAVRARDQFLAVASHELKTPLAPLRTRIQMLERLVARGELETLPREKLVRILTGADAQVLRLVGLIDDLLDVTRLGTKRFRLDVAPTDLASVIRDVAERHHAELVAAGCSLRLELASAPGVWDQARLEQVFTNLLTNAMKYARGAPIEVRLEADAARARLVVRDHGPGIPPDYRERVFRAFERGPRGGGVSGHGLGLFIVREIVRAHGGEILLESAEGGGTAFTIELPRSPPASA